MYGMGRLHIPKEIITQIDLDILIYHYIYIYIFISIEGYGES